MAKWKPESVGGIDVAPAITVEAELIVDVGHTVRRPSPNRVGPVRRIVRIARGSASPTVTEGVLRVPAQAAALSTPVIVRTAAASDPFDRVQVIRKATTRSADRDARDRFGNRFWPDVPKPGKRPAS